MTTPEIRSVPTPQKTEHITLGKCLLRLGWRTTLLLVGAYLVLFADLKLPYRMGFALLTLFQSAACIDLISRIRQVKRSGRYGIEIAVKEPTPEEKYFQRHFCLAAVLAGLWFGVTLTLLSLFPVSRELHITLMQINTMLTMVVLIVAMTVIDWRAKRLASRVIAPAATTEADACITNKEVSPVTPTQKSWWTESGFRDEVQTSHQVRNK